MTRAPLVTAIAVAAALSVIAFFFASNLLTLPQTGQTASLAQQQTTGTNGLVVQDESVGTGSAVTTGDIVTVNYTGKLQDGTVFDSTQGKTPQQFQVGDPQIIPGWNAGLQGMKVGGKRLLIIPAELAYGSQAVGPIPANSTLIFEVDLLDIQTPSTTPAQSAQ